MLKFGDSRYFGVSKVFFIRYHLACCKKKKEKIELFSDVGLHYFSVSSSKYRIRIWTASFERCSVPIVILPSLLCFECLILHYAQGSDDTLKFLIRPNQGQRIFALIRASLQYYIFTIELSCFNIVRFYKKKR